VKTERIYYQYSSATPYEGEILEVRPYRHKGGDALALLLDKTIFYPEGGGQPGDRGTINGVALLDVHEKDGEILHIIALPSPAAGDIQRGPAVLTLDAGRRRDLTVQHTGQHLLSGTILRQRGKHTVSMHLGDELCTIDVDAPDLSPGEILTAEDAVADAIEENRPVITHLCPPEDARTFPLRKIPPQGEEVIRVVEISGHDFSPCCGTHLKSTGEIGMLRVLGMEKYKGMVRLSFIAGRRCLWESRMLRKNGDLISRRLSAPLAEIGAGVEALLEKAAAMERRIKALEEADAAAKADLLLARAEAAAAESGPEAPAGETAGMGGAAKGALIIETCDGADMEEVLRIGRAAQKKTAALLVLASERDLKFAAFSVDKKLDLRVLFKDAMEAHGGRGGGGGGFFQGQFESAETLRAFLSGLRKR
jgi:alanyl-tRNA synthetase